MDNLDKFNKRYLIRELCVSDYDLNYFGLLSQLTDVGVVTKSDFIKQFAKPNGNDHREHYVMVIIDLLNNKLVGTGTIFFEPKFIHGCRSVGHIEDIVISEDYRSQHLGYHLIERLLRLSELPEHNCYKVILDCDTKVIPFYQKFGFAIKENHMAKYF